MPIDTSVIITNFNREKYLGRAIRSCLKQSMDRGMYEIIIVDDASTDDSRKVIETFEDSIIPVYLGKNVGIAGASNMGIKKALGRFVIRVDADDYISENTLLFMTEILINNPDIGFVYCDHIKVDEEERFLERENLDNLNKIFGYGAGMMFRKSNLEAIGLYDEKRSKHADDYDLLIRYLKNFDGYHLKLPLYRYRQHEGNTTKQIEKRNKNRREVEKKYNLKNIRL